MLSIGGGCHQNRKMPIQLKIFGMNRVHQKGGEAKTIFLKGGVGGGDQKILARVGGGDQKILARVGGGD